MGGSRQLAGVAYVICHQFGGVGVGPGFGRSVALTLAVLSWTVLVEMCW